MASLADGDVLSCKVKWYSPAKGYGFLVSPEIDTDILLHSNVLKTFGRSTVANDVVLEVKVSSSSGRLQVISIEGLHANANKPISPFVENASYTSEELALIPFLPARVKWFDVSKGIGFANVFGQREDIFLHADVLRWAGLASLDPGEAVALRVVEGDRGYFAAEISSWI